MKKTVVKKKAPVKKTAKKTAVKKKLPVKKTAKKTAVKKKLPASNKKATTNRKVSGLKKSVAASQEEKMKITKITAKTKQSPASRKKSSEEYMNPTQVEHYRGLLLVWKNELMQEVDRTVHHMQDDASNFPDPNDRATQEEELALELRTRDRERKLIKKINETLLTLDSGDYGYCEICGIEIGAKRLEARPTATLCIDCKTLDEIKERQLG